MSPFKSFVEKIDRHVDDRGSVYGILDRIGHNAHVLEDHFPASEIERVYFINNWKAGMVRAWHGHKVAWTGLHVISGAAKIVVLPFKENLDNIDRNGNILIHTASNLNPSIVWAPPGYFNGAVTLKPNTQILCFSSLSLDKAKTDDYRDSVVHSDHIDFFNVEDR